MVDEKFGGTVDWEDPFFEEEYTYLPEWKEASNEYYDMFAEEYNIPKEWFLFKVFKQQDTAGSLA